MSESDKYPAESDRRRFVKGVVGGAALAGVGTAGSVTVNSLTSAAGAGGGQTTAMAIKNTGGPAPRGMPQIPVEITDDGFLRGKWPKVTTETQQGIEVQVAKEDMPGDVTYAGEWFQYCGLEGYENIEPTFESDNIFRASSTGYDWQTQEYEAGEKVRADSFKNYKEWGNGIGKAGVGKPISATWRSKDADNTIPVTIIRSDLIKEAAKDSEWLQASTEKGFIAWLNVCTHFCCVPGYKTTEDSAKYGAENGVYCPCHQSTYDPFSIVETIFVANPRPSD